MATEPNPPSLVGEGGARSELGERIVAVARTWIGTPYVHQASVKGAGCDCLGLLRGVWRELRGGEPQSVPPYGREARGEETLLHAFRRHLTEIPPAALGPGDVALFRMAPHGPARHCAVVAENRGAPTLIHCRANGRVAEEAFTPAWRRRLSHAFRI